MTFSSPFVRLSSCLAAFLIFGWIFSGCDVGPAATSDDADAPSFSLTTLSDASVEARVEGFSTTTLESHRTGPSTMRGNVTVGDAAITLTADLDAQEMTVDAGNASLTALQKEALRTIASRLRGAVESRGATLPAHAKLMARMTTYWSEAPPQHTLLTRKIAAASKRDEGIACISVGATVTAQYDSDGTVNQTTGYGYSDAVVVGSTARAGYECMGRCGPGCQPWYAFDSAWCKDCLDHDQCSNVFYASGGSSDPNCGDEYDEAADDWAWGIANGCLG